MDESREIATHGKQNGTPVQPNQQCRSDRCDDTSLRKVVRMVAAMSRSHLCASRQFGSATSDYPGIRWVAVDIEMCEGDASMLHAGFFELIEGGICGQSIQTVKKALSRIACDGHIHAHEIILVPLRSIVCVVAPRKSLR